MKLYRVLLLFFFSCAILFVGAVSDISADAQVNGPYTAEAYVYRVNTANVILTAKASSTPRAKNGKYKLVANKDSDLNRQVETWDPLEEQTHLDTHGAPIDGEFSEELKRNYPSTEYGYQAKSLVDGQLTDGAFRAAFAEDKVGEIPILEPTPVPQPQLGISPVDPDDTPYPGEAHEYRLVTEAPYYYVNWYVKAPWETSERGSYIGSDSGDGTTTESTFSYTFPSGAMHTGDFLITAVIYRWSDMSEYEETYTATVSLD